MSTPGGYSAGTIFLQVVPSFRNFHEALRKEAKVANKAWADAQDRARRDQADKDAKAAEKRGKDSGSRYVKALNDAVKGASDALPDMKIKADSSDIERAIFEIKKKIDAIKDKDIKLGVDSREAAREIRSLELLLRRLALNSTDVEVTANTAAATAELQKFLKQFGTVERARATAKVDVDVDDATSKLARLRKTLADVDNNGGAMRLFNIRVLAAATALPLLVPAAIAAAGAIAAIGPAAIAGATGLGILIAGFTGIGPAVKALGDVQKNAAKDALAAAKSQRLAARAIRDAEQGVARARESAGQAAADAARRVADAREQEGRVAEDNAQRLEDALRAQSRAEETLADAQKDARRAQRELTEARQESQDQLEDLAIRVKGGALAERAAVVDLFEAQVAYNAAMQDGAATNLDRENASIALGQARLRLEQQRLDNSRLIEEQTSAKAQGVEGTERVVQARDRVADANERVADSTRGVVEANERVVDVQKDNSRAAADAARVTKDALEDQARSFADNARSMRDAQERLMDARAAYRESLQQTTASQDALNESMSKLGPAGQAFARFLYSDIMPALREMRMAIQEGMLPGVTDALRTIMGTYGPQLVGFLGVMGKVIGDIFRDLAVMFTTPVWQDFFTMMGQYAPIFTRLLADLGGKLLTIFAQLMTAFAPLAEDMLEWLVEGATRLSEFLASAEGKQALADFMETVRRVGPMVVKFIVALGKGLFNLGKGLAPYAEKMLTSLTGFLDFIAQMDPRALGVITIGIIALTVAIQVLAGIASAFGAIAFALASVLGVTALGTIAAVAAGVLLLAGIFVIAYTQSEIFRNVVDTTFRVIGTAISWFWTNVIKPVFGFIVGVFKFAAEVIVAVLDMIFKTFKYTFTELGKWWDRWTAEGWPKTFRETIEKLAGFFVSVWAEAFQELKKIFSGGVYFIVETVLNDGLIDSFNWLAEKVGSKKIGRINLPASFGKQDGDKAGKAPGVYSGGAGLNKANRFATGGKVGGFSPSPIADNIPAWLTAGEYVLPVNAVKSIRGKYGDDFLEMLRQGLPGYASGGVVGFGRMLQKRGFRVGEHPAFGGVAPVHKGRGHYEGRAIDVNFGPGGESDIEKRAIDSIVGLAKDYGLSVIWRAAGHFNHAHFEQGGPNILGKAGDAIGGLWDSVKDLAGKVVSAPVKYLTEKVASMFSGSEDNGLTGLLKGLAGRAAESLGNLLLGTPVGDEKDPASLQTSGPIAEIVRNAAAARGWGAGAEWEALRSIITRESGFNPTAQNPRSTAFGLFQFLDSTWGATGFSKSSDPAVQTAAGLRYIEQRYGSPTKAKQFWDANGWYSKGGEVTEGGTPTLYDTGGWLQPGLTTVLNATNKPEPVFTSEQWDMIRTGGGVGGGGTTIEINTQTTSTASDIAHEVLFASRQMRRGGVHATRKAP